MRDYLNCEANEQSSAFFVPECWVVGGGTHRTVLLSPALVSWREEEEKLLSLRHWIHSPYLNPNFSTSPDLFFIGLSVVFASGFPRGKEKAAAVGEGQLAASGWWRVQRVCLFGTREGKGQGAWFWSPQLLQLGMCRIYGQVGFFMNAQSNPASHMQSPMFPHVCAHNILLWRYWTKYIFFFLKFWVEIWESYSNGAAMQL